MSSLCIDELSPISFNSLSNTFVLTPNLLLHADDSVKSDDLDLSLLGCSSGEDNSAVEGSPFRFKSELDFSEGVKEGQSTPISDRNPHDVSAVVDNDHYHQQHKDSRFCDGKIDLRVNHDHRAHWSSLEVRQIINYAALPCSPLHEVQELVSGSGQVAHCLAVRSSLFDEVCRCPVESGGSASVTCHSSPLLEEIETFAENKQGIDHITLQTSADHRESGERELSLIRSGAYSNIAKSCPEPCNSWKESITALDTETCSGRQGKRENVADADIEPNNFDWLQSKESRPGSEWRNSLKPKDKGNYVESDAELHKHGMPRNRESIAESDTKPNSSCIPKSKESIILIGQEPADSRGPTSKESIIGQEPADSCIPTSKESIMGQEPADSCRTGREKACVQKSKSLHKRKKVVRKKTFTSDSDISVDFKRNQKKCRNASDSSNIYGFDWESPLPLRRSKRIPKRRFKADFVDSDSESSGPVRKSQRIQVRKRLNSSCSDGELPVESRTNERVPRKKLCTKYSKTSHSCEDVGSRKKIDGTIEKQNVTIHGEQETSCHVAEGAGTGQTPVQKQPAKFHGKEEPSCLDGQAPQSQRGIRTDTRPNSPEFIPVAHIVYKHRSPAAKNTAWSPDRVKNSCKSDKVPSRKKTTFSSNIEKKLVHGQTEQKALTESADLESRAEASTEESASFQDRDTDGVGHATLGNDDCVETLQQNQTATETQVCLEASHSRESLKPQQDDREKENTPLSPVKMHLKFKRCARQVSSETINIDRKASCSLKTVTCHSRTDHRGGHGSHEIISKSNSAQVTAVRNKRSKSKPIPKIALSTCAHITSFKRKASKSNSAQGNHKGKSVSKLKPIKEQFVFKIKLKDPFDPFYKQKLRKNGSLHTTNETDQKERKNCNQKQRKNCELKSTVDQTDKDHTTDPKESKNCELKSTVDQTDKDHTTDPKESKNCELKSTVDQTDKDHTTDPKESKNCELKSTVDQTDKDHTTDPKESKNCELKSTVDQTDKDHKTDPKERKNCNQKQRKNCDQKQRKNCELKYTTGNTEKNQCTCSISASESQSVDCKQQVENGTLSNHGHYLTCLEPAAACPRRQKGVALKGRKGQWQGKKASLTTCTTSVKQKSANAAVPRVKQSKLYKSKRKIPHNRAYECSTEEDVPQTFETKPDARGNEISPLKAAVSDPEPSASGKVLSKQSKSEKGDKERDSNKGQHLKRKKGVKAKGSLKAKGSHNRHRGGEEKAYNFVTLARAIVTEAEAIKFCQENGLLPQSSHCPKCCGFLTKLYKIVRTVNTISVEFRFQCNRKMCKSRGQLPVRNVHWFSKSNNIQCSQHLLIFYLFSNQFTAEQAVDESVVLCENVDVSKTITHNQVKAVCSESVKELYNFCREVCVLSLPDPKPIGGSNCTVVILEAQFGKTKHCVQHFPEGQFVLGAFCRQTDVVFLVPVPALESEHVIPVIQKYVKKGTEVQTDNSDIYRRLGMLGYKHVALNHAHHDLDPETGRCLKHNKDSIWWMRKDPQASRPSSTSTSTTKDPPASTRPSSISTTSLHAHSSWTESLSSSASTDIGQSLGYHSHTSSHPASSTPVLASIKTQKKKTKASTPVLDSTATKEDLSGGFADVAHLSIILKARVSSSSVSSAQRGGSGSSWDVFGACADDSGADGLSAGSAAASSLSTTGGTREGGPAGKVSSGADGDDWIFALPMAEFLWRRIHRDDKDIFLSFLQAVEQVFPADQQ